MAARKSLIYIFNSVICNITTRQAIRTVTFKLQIHVNDVTYNFVTEKELVLYNFSYDNRSTSSSDVSTFVQW